MRKGYRSCRQTALINHASINHFLRPAFIDWTEGQPPFTAQFLLFGGLSAPPPLPRPFMPAAAAGLQLSLCSSRYDCWGIVKQLLANSCSTLISTRHWGGGGEGVLGAFSLKCYFYVIFIYIEPGDVSSWMHTIHSEIISHLMYVLCSVELDLLNPGAPRRADPVPAHETLSAPHWRGPFTCEQLSMHLCCYWYVAHVAVHFNLNQEHSVVKCFLFFSANKQLWANWSLDKLLN